MTVLFLCREENLVREVAGYARALRRRGIQVICLPQSFTPKENLERLLERAAEPPQLLFHPDIDVFLPEGLTSSRIPTALLQADPYAYTHRRLRWGMLFDYVLLLHGGFEERFRSAGHPAAVTLPHAVDAGYFDGPEQERLYDVSSVGRVDGPNYRTRFHVLSSLSAQFKMNEWARPHSYPGLADVYRKTKIVVNIGRDDYPSDVSLRFAEAMAAGALFVTPLPSEMERYGFIENIHYAGFREKSELIPLVKQFLGDEPARRKIAEAGRGKVLREHTYDCRVEALLERLARDNGRLFAPARCWPEARVRLTYLDYFAAHGALDCARTELRQIARRSPAKAAVGAALWARAWTRRELFSRA